MGSNYNLNLKAFKQKSDFTDLNLRMDNFKIPTTYVNPRIEERCRKS